ncbi:hypothetical protein KR018_004857 [Drosophila ironensis]|nr:hypothetical protein KR018_004857 [Drosophila ironensis]
MSRWLELCLSGYFQALGLTCGWSSNRLGRLLSSSFLLLVCFELCCQIRSYFNDDYPVPDYPVSIHFVRTVQSVNVGYRVLHAIMAFTAIFQCQRSRRILEQLPEVRMTPFVCRQLILEVGLSVYVIILGGYEAQISGYYLENLRYAYSSVAVRGRYLQMLLLVDRLDHQMKRLHDRISGTRAVALNYQALRLEYAHLAKLSRSLSQLYGLSLLLLNVLCLGDCLIVCNVYFMVDYFDTLPASWWIFAQAVYIILPTLVKLSTLCAACHRCAGKSKLLQAQLKDRPGHTRAARSQTEEFALQIMQDPIQFDVCGIYNLNLQTLAGMFFFILEALVIFLQFVSLLRPPALD